MSYIDSYKHELIGLFGGRWVYHPLEDIPGCEDHEDEFSCSVDQIVIGGGSGEWPGLVVRCPTGAVVSFLDNSLEDDDLYKKISKSDWYETCDEYRYKETIFQYCGWSVTEYHRFFELCCSASMPNAFQEDNEMSFQDWLSCSIGEFIYFAMPELAMPIMSKLKAPYVDVNHIHFNNLLIVPPNMPVYANGGNAWDVNRKQRG